MPDDNPSQAEAILANAFADFLKTQKIDAGLVPARDDEGDDNVQMVRNGWVRIKAQGIEYRLRTVTFGQLKVLFTLMEEQQDALTMFRETALRRERALKTRLETEVDPMEEGEAKWGAQAELAIELRKVVRSIRDKGNELRMVWWTKAFELANAERTGETERSKGQVPREWPAWVANEALPTRVLEHWRAVPLGRG